VPDPTRTPLRAADYDQEAVGTAIRSMRVDRGRAYQVGPDGTVVLWDLDLVAYLMCNNVNPADIWRDGPEFRVVFRETEERIRKLHIEYLSSKESRFAAAIKMIKKAAHSIGSRPPR